MNKAEFKILVQTTKALTPTVQEIARSHERPISASLVSKVVRKHLGEIERTLTALEAKTGAKISLSENDIFQMVAAEIAVIERKERSIRANPRVDHVNLKSRAGGWHPALHDLKQKTKGHTGAQAYDAAIKEQLRKDGFKIVPTTIKDRAQRTIVGAGRKAKPKKTLKNPAKKYLLYSPGDSFFKKGYLGKSNGSPVHTSPNNARAFTAEEAKELEAQGYHKVPLNSKRTIRTGKVKRIGRTRSRA